MQVIGQKNEQYLVILAVDENAALQEEEPHCVILDTANNTVSPSLPVDRLLGQGYWQRATMPESELYTRLAMATHQPGRDGTPAKDLIPAEIK
jgi:hypothetical protein